MTTVNPINTNTRSFHPVKFTIWLLMIASTMLFAAFSSAYIVHRSDNLENGQWMQFDIPQWFFISTGVVIVSSILVQLSFYLNKKGNKVLSPVFLFLTVCAGLLFGWSQMQGYAVLVENEIYFRSESAAGISGSFFYVITGMHLAHIILGLLILIYTLIQLLRGKVNSEKSLMMYVSSAYWHFLGFLWIYLFLFLYLTR